MKTTFTTMGTNDVELQIELEDDDVIVSLVPAAEEIVLDAAGLNDLEEFLKSSTQPRPG